MTIRQLADTAGCGLSTAKRIGKVMYPAVKSVGRGIALDYNKEQSIEIMSKLPKREFVNIGQMTQPDIGQITQGVNVEQFAKLIGIAISQSLAPVVARLDSLEVKQLKAPKEDYFSLLAYCSLHDIDTNRSELAVHGMGLRKMTLSYGKAIRKIPDERYGQVNSYPVEILDKYFEF